jgi:hypothetical protein
MINPGDMVTYLGTRFTMYDKPSLNRRIREREIFIGQKNIIFVIASVDADGGYSGWMWYYVQVLSSEDKGYVGTLGWLGLPETSFNVMMPAEDHDSNLVMSDDTC